MGVLGNPFALPSQGLDANGKAIYRNRQEELRDPDYQRSGRYEWRLADRLLLTKEKALLSYNGLSQASRLNSDTSF